MARAHVGTQHLRTPEYHDIRPLLLDGTFEVSVMLLEEPWTRFETQFGERSILAVAPARDILACCPSHVGAVIAMRTPTALTWLAADHHGTTETTVASAGLAATRRRSLPFGGTRGTGTGTWPTAMDKGFLRRHTGPDRPDTPRRA